MRLSQKQIDAVLSLDGNARYQHFIKEIVGNDEIWGLFNGGWAMSEDQDGNQQFPLWPASEYARLCAVGAWEKYKPESFDLEDFLDNLLPKLDESGVGVSIFMTPTGLGTTPDIGQFADDISAELDKY